MKNILSLFASFVKSVPALFVGLIVCSASLSGQATYHFINLTAGADLQVLSNWNTESDGSGTAPVAFSNDDNWFFNSRVRVTTAPRTFPVTLTANGSNAEVDARGSTSAPTLTRAVVPNGSLLTSEPRDNFNNFITFDALEIQDGGNFRLRSAGNTQDRTLNITVGSLEGSGTFLFGDSVEGRENNGINLDLTDASFFTGLIRVRNTVASFTKDTDVSNGSMTIAQASATDRVTTFIMNHDLIFGSLQVHTTVLSPGVYDATALNTIAGSARISFIDNGGTFQVIPEPSSAALLSGVAVLMLLFLRRRSR
jgi:hypothetical protein